MRKSIHTHRTTSSSPLLFVMLIGLGSVATSGCGSSDFESRAGRAGNAGAEVNDGGSGGAGGLAGAGGSGGMAGPGGSGGLGNIGMPCESNAGCVSGHCIEGICCDSACDEACVACTAAKTGASNGTCAPVLQGTDPRNDCEPEPATTCGNSTGACNGAGACEKHPSGTVCGPVASCVNSSQTSAAACDGNGACQPGTTISCLPYVCGSMSCLTMCVDDSSCAAGHYCVGGTCTAKKPDGQVCNAANECQSGSCITFFGDDDADGYGNAAKTIQGCSMAPTGYVANSSDCDDSNMAIHPGAAEICGNNMDDNCNGITNDPAVCCVPYNGQYDVTTIQLWTTDTYLYHDYWCVVGSGLPPGCYGGYLIQSQSIADAHCVSVGSGGQCTDQDALWSITCNNAVNCVYQCDGQCIPLSC